MSNKIASPLTILTELYNKYLAFEILNKYKKYLHILINIEDLLKIKSILEYNKTINRFIIYYLAKQEIINNDVDKYMLSLSESTRFFGKIEQQLLESYVQYLINTNQATDLSLYTKKIIDIKNENCYYLLQQYYDHLYNEYKNDEYLKLYNKYCKILLDKNNKGFLNKLITSGNLKFISHPSYINYIINNDHKNYIFEYYSNFDNISIKTICKLIKTKPSWQSHYEILLMLNNPLKYVKKYKINIKK